MGQLWDNPALDIFWAHPLSPWNYSKKSPPPHGKPPFFQESRKSSLFYLSPRAGETWPQKFYSNYTHTNTIPGPAFSPRTARLCGYVRLDALPDLFLAKTCKIQVWAGSHIWRWVGPEPHISLDRSYHMINIPTKTGRKNSSPSLRSSSLYSLQFFFPPLYIYIYISLYISIYREIYI